MKKRILILTMALCLMLPMTVSAKGTLSPQELCPSLSDADVENVEMIFDVERQVKIVDADGNNVTQRFIAENRLLYDANDYMPILDYLIDNGLVIEEPYVESGIAPFALKSTASTGTRIVYFKSPVTGEESKEWIKFRIEGDYQVVDSTGTISTGVLPARFIFVSKSQSSLWVYGDVDSSTYVISNDKKTITFSAEYTVSIGFIAYIPLNSQSGHVSFAGHVG